MVEADGGKFGADQFYQTAQNSATQKICSIHKTLFCCVAFLIQAAFALVFVLEDVCSSDHFYMPSFRLQVYLTFLKI